MSETEKGIVETLSAIDVSEYVKEKNGNKYLPWARCWSIVKSYYPQSDYFDEAEDGDVIKNRFNYNDGTGNYSEKSEIDKENMSYLVRLKRF